jgi:energy-coupling factor transport system ATP-binding protein
VAVSLSFRGRFRYPGASRDALAGEFEVGPGELVAVAGANGSGKSTLARLLVGLIQPAEGEVRLDGGPLDAAPGAVGLVFQDPDAGLVAATVEEDVAFGPENLALPRADLARRVSGALGRLGLDGLANREPALLSGGQKQRVAIAGALALQPRYLVLDEATAMLDREGRESLLALLDEIRGEIGIVLITHQLTEALRADRLVVLAGGAPVASGRPGEVLARGAAAREWGLVPPAFLELAWRLAVDAAPRSPDELAELLARRYPRDGARTRQPTERVWSMPRPERPAIRAFDVAYRYPTTLPGQPDALRGASLVVQGDGVLQGLIGRSGCGKSTLLRALVALLPAKGRIRIDEYDLAVKKDRKPARARASLVFQEPETSLFAATVREELTFAPANFGNPPGEVARRVEWAAERLRIAHLLDRNPFQLSGGEQRRVALAATLAVRPGYWLLDEPTGSLDPAGRVELAALVRELAWEGTSVLAVTHDTDFLAGVVSWAVVMSEGLCGAVRDADGVFTDLDGLAAAGVAPPETVRVAGELRRRGVDVPLTCGVEDLVAALEQSAGEAAR